MVSTKADQVLRCIERMAERRYLPIIGPERGRVLVDLVHRFKPKRILEIGTLVGYSTILMGKKLEGDAEIVTIEIDKDEAEMAEKNIREADVEPKIIVLVGDASEIIPTLEGSFDMIFLDAAKSKYLNHLRLIEDKIHKGSVIIADNAGIYAYLMKNYLDYVRNSGKYRTWFIPVDEDGLEVSIKLYEVIGKVKK